jgi:hypothetical protein
VSNIIATNFDAIFEFDKANMLRSNAHVDTGWYKHKKKAERCMLVEEIAQASSEAAQN